MSVLLVFALLLSACGGGYTNPADIPAVYRVRNAPYPIAQPLFKPSVKIVQAKAREAARGRHRVQRGDTLYALSKRYGFSVRDFVTENRLRAPYTLSVGQALRIPRPKTHTVRSGETGYSISRQYGVSVRDLMRVNKIRAPFTLSVGQRLTLPGGAVRVANNRRSGPGARRSSRPSDTSRKRVVSSNNRPPPRTGSRFSWPVKGRVISGFGPKAGGIHNDGINISARKGTAIKAAEAGVVVYAADVLEGFGNMVLIRHAGGWITAYAHADSLSVKEGDKVQRGSTIGKVGDSGGVPEPQLHFEVRKGRQALDPTRYLSR